MCERCPYLQKKAEAGNSNSGGKCNANHSIEISQGVARIVMPSYASFSPETNLQEVLAGASLIKSCTVSDDPKGQENCSRNKDIPK